MVAVGGLVGSLLNAIVTRRKTRLFLNQQMSLLHDIAPAVHTRSPTATFGLTSLLGLGLVLRELLFSQFQYRARAAFLNDMSLDAFIQLLLAHIHRLCPDSGLDHTTHNNNTKKKKKENEKSEGG